MANRKTQINGRKHMHILRIIPLQLPEVRVIRVARVPDGRGYFTEVVREEQLVSHPELSCLRGQHFVQVNESQSAAGVVRGLHLQVEPDLVKLVRVLDGHIIDVAVDARPTSPTFGIAAAYELKGDSMADFEDMVLVPSGFVHALFVIRPSRVQYFQTGTWHGAGEVSICPRAPDIDWTHLDAPLLTQVQNLLENAQMNEKDLHGLSLAEWKQHPLAGKM